MAKKYLSIEEAAAQIGVNATELNRLREKGMIRAFADRGTWKFKEEDVEKLMRSRDSDSNPDVTINLSPVENSVDSATVNLAPVEDSADQSVIDDEDVLAEQPTIVRKSPGEDSSDSDVRLIFDDAMKVEGTAVPPLPGDSDSDVKLAAPPGASSDDSDSDVKLAGSKEGILEMGSDSDVKLVMDDVPLKDASGSDSDVRLVSSDSSGEVKLVDSGTSGEGIPLVKAEDSSIGEATDDGGSVMEEDSGISLAEGSGLSLASDSGISLESPNDSGISLSGESSLVLSADSGISLAGDGSHKGDSGISLAGDASLKGDSGISLAGQPAKKKKPVQPDEDLSGTVPLMDVPL
ncbi:MAG TPA: helix-turn-helix domain-containing protein, partial [Planctomycetaceae bacterium]